MPISLPINHIQGHTPERIHENQIISTLIFVQDTLYMVFITGNLDNHPTKRSRTIVGIEHTEEKDLKRK